MRDKRLNFLMLGVVCLLASSFCLTLTAAAQQPDVFVKRRGADKIIVFAHGILGDARGTFTNDTTHAYWPQLLAEDTDMDSFDILAINYDAGVTSRMSIEQIATVVRTTLADHRVFDDYNEIYFVCHSMGGLVVKRIMIDLWQARSPTVGQQISGIIFISTPAKGANAANYLEILARMGGGARPLVDLRTYDVNTFLQTVENQWKDYFDQGRRDQVPRVFVAYEMQATYGYLVVPELYAETPHDGRAYPVTADHFSIVKPADRISLMYDWVKHRIQEASEAHASVPYKEWGTGQADWTKLDNIIRQFSLPTAKRDGFNLRISGDASAIREVGQLSVQGTYRAATWADLFDRIAASNPCIHFNVSRSRRELTFSSPDTPKQCPTGRAICSGIAC
ncbi:esterase/lipase family protein [Bradyrhizobium sp. 521_C7_N1_3]|uniref:esterase/lipase family protein n=1 Tax=Bradyrhizobium sp. 521_C7_N1_3 TaxID=3240368 RepID=UPI003F889CE2